MKKTITLLMMLMLISYNSYSQRDIQPDSIEYCWWRQIFDFKLSNNQYYFSEFKINTPVESDSLIFNSSKYFMNFPVILDYTDSVRFAIVSRTLKFYKEPILYNYPKPFIRIIWLRYKTPILITLLLNNDSTNVIYKETNGSLDIHGSITKQKIKSFPAEIITKSFEKLEKSDFFNLKHGIRFCHEDNELMGTPSLFIEAFDGKRYNIIILNECNLDYDKYKCINNIMKFIFKIMKLPKFKIISAYNFPQ